MADNEPSKIRYDDFIGSVQPDPAKPESTIMLSGFVGHGPEGHARVYPDPTLGTWYDIPEGDILHSMPIADSKLGGSYIWVRASSEIKPGNAAPAATEAGAAQPQQPAAAVNPTPRTHCHVCDPPMAAAAQPTPTPQTHCFICPPHTQAVHCWTAPVVCDTMQMPTLAPRAFSFAPTLCPGPFTMHCTLLCPAALQAAAAPAQVLPNTAATVCTQLGCPLDGMVPTVWCSWVGCAPHQAPQAQAAPQLAAFQPNPSAVTHCLICQPRQTVFAPCTELCFTTFHGCPPIQHTWICNMAQTGVTVCVTDCLPPGNQMMKAAAVGVNPMDPTPATRCFFCDPPMAAAAMQPTPTVQTHCFICPPHTQNCMPGTYETGVFFCRTRLTGCTVHVCTEGCPQGGAQQQPAAMMMAAPVHPNTAATLCTQQPACPPHTVHNSMCICPTPSAVHQCGGQAFTPTIPQFTVVGMCPTFGVCPSMACTPMTPIQNGVFTPFGR